MHKKGADQEASKRRKARKGNTQVRNLSLSEGIVCSYLTGGLYGGLCGRPYIIRSFPHLCTFVTQGRAVFGASLEEIKKKRDQSAAARSTARAKALRSAKDKKATFSAAQPSLFLFAWRFVWGVVCATVC